MVDGLLLRREVRAGIAEQLGNRNGREIRIGSVSVVSAAVPSESSGDDAQTLPSRGALVDAPRGRDERRIVRALARQSPEALELVVSAYGRVLTGYLESVLSDRALAEDVLQQVLVEIWERRATYEPARAGVLTWAMTIARSRAIDELRRRVPEPIDPATVADLSPAQVDPTDRLLESWRIAGILERLPRDEASLLRMRFFDGMTQSEIAQQTGIPAGTIKLRMVNGMRQLRTMLEAESGVTG